MKTHFRNKWYEFNAIRESQKTEASKKTSREDGNTRLEELRETCQEGVHAAQLYPCHESFGGVETPDSRITTAMPVRQVEGGPTICLTKTLSPNPSETIPLPQTT